MNEDQAVGSAAVTEPSHLRHVAVFCASSAGRNAAITDATVALGQALAAAKIGLVYGGAGVGLMGLIADTVLAEGGEVVGVMPANLPDEIAHRGLTELIETDDLQERKRVFYERSDGVIALPGGLGTLEEVFEAATWTQLGLHSLPVGLLNADGYYDHLVAFLDRAVDDGLLRAENRALIIDDVDPVALIDQLGRVNTDYTPKWDNERA